MGFVDDRRSARRWRSGSACRSRSRRARGRSPGSLRIDLRGRPLVARRSPRRARRRGRPPTPWVTARWPHGSRLVRSAITLTERARQPMRATRCPALLDADRTGRRRGRAAADRPGPGLTPSGDDALAGIEAALHALAQPLAGFLGRAGRHRGPHDRGAAAMLRHAARGEFAERLHDPCCRAHRDPGDAGAAIARRSGLGRDVRHGLPARRPAGLDAVAGEGSVPGGGWPERRSTPASSGTATAIRSS